MTNRTFRDMLTKRQVEVDSLVCVGLDPLVEKLPKHIKSALEGDADRLLFWMLKVVDSTAQYASMFKPQLAHWEAIKGGVDALRDLIAHIHDKHPGIPVFADCKRGDIDRTQKQYAQAILGSLNADGMNYNGYMGKDTLASLVAPEYAGRAFVGLGRTSNKDAWEIQDSGSIMGRGTYFWEYMVERMLAWSTELGVLDNAGVVMGAAHIDPKDSEKKHIVSWHLARAREIVGDKMWFLIPGIGTQGGFVEETVKAAFRGPGSIVINSSSGIIFASSGQDYAEAAAREAMNLRDQIREAGGSCAKA